MAGGDIVTGSATVILFSPETAQGQGRRSNSASEGPR